jgi:antibiotic biosynthesis monooxygenase (ABM) superfamily enzyme
MLLVYVIAVVTLVLAQLHRDATLSNLTNTKPGELGSDFWIRATSFIVLPLLTFLASQFPQINRLLYSWLEPALRALNK